MLTETFICLLRVCFLSRLKVSEIKLWSVESESKVVRGHNFDG